MTRVTRLAAALVLSLAGSARGAGLLSATVPADGGLPPAATTASGSMGSGPAGSPAARPEPPSPLPEPADQPESATPAVARRVSASQLFERLDQIEEDLRALRTTPAGSGSPTTGSSVPAAGAGEAPALGPSGASAYPEVVVSASRPRSNLQDIPATVDVVAVGDLKPTGGDAAGDALARAGLASLFRYPAAFQNLYVRGYKLSENPENSQVSVLIGGRPAGASNLGEMPLEGLERIEVVRGAGSALFGSSAMGGAINLVPRRGRGAPAGTVAAEGGSWDDRRLRADYGGEAGPVDFAVSANRLTAGAYQVPGVAAPQAATRDEWNGSANVGVTFAGANRLGVAGYGFFGDRLGNPGSLSFPEDPGAFYRKRFTTGEVDLTGSAAGLSWDQAVYASREAQVFHDLFGGFATLTNSIGDQTGGKHLLTAEAPGLGAVTAGVEWFRRTSEDTSPDSTPFQPQSRTRNLAGLAEARVRVPATPVTLSGGVRLDRFTETAAQPSDGLPIPGTLDRESTWRAVTARGGVVADLAPVRLHASVGSGFRAPVAYELASNYTDPFGFTYRGNPGLDPERSLTAEAGASVTAGRAEATLTGFRTRFDRKIQRVLNDAGEQTWVNLDGASVGGLEGKLEFALPGRGSVAVKPYVDGTYHARLRDEDPTDNVRNGTAVLLYVPRWFGGAGLGVADRPGQAQGWSGRVAASAQGLVYQQDFTNGGVVTLPPFAVFSLEAAYWPNDAIRIYATVDNALDQRIEYVLDYPVPGLTALAGVEVRI